MQMEDFKKRRRFGANLPHQQYPHVDGEEKEHITEQHSDHRNESDDDKQDRPHQDEKQRQKQKDKEKGGAHSNRQHYDDVHYDKVHQELLPHHDGKPSDSVSQHHQHSPLQIEDPKALEQYLTLWREGALQSPTLAATTNTKGGGKTPPPAQVARLEDIAEQLTDIRCPVCLDPFQQPVTLPCNHNICKQHVLDLRAYHPSTSASMEDGAPFEIECPKCRANCAFQSVDAIRVNQEMNGIVQAMLKLLAATGEGKVKENGPEVFCLSSETKSLHQVKKDHKIHFTKGTKTTTTTSATKEKRKVSPIMVARSRSTSPTTAAEGVMKQQQQKKAKVTFRSVSPSGEEADQVIEEIGREGRRVGGLLHDHQQTENHNNPKVLSAEKKLAQLEEQLKAQREQRKLEREKNQREQVQKYKEKRRMEILERQQLEQEEMLVLYPSTEQKPVLSAATVGFEGFDEEKVDRYHLQGNKETTSDGVQSSHTSNSNDDDVRRKEEYSSRIKKGEVLVGGGTSAAVAQYLQHQQQKSKKEQQEKEVKGNPITSLHQLTNALETDDSAWAEAERKFFEIKRQREAQKEVEREERERKLKEEIQHWMKGATEITDKLRGGGVPHHHHHRFDFHSTPAKEGRSEEGGNEGSSFQRMEKFEEQKKYNNDYGIDNFLYDDGGKTVSSHSPGGKKLLHVFGTPKASSENYMSPSEIKRLQEANDSEGQQFLPPSPPKFTNNNFSSSSSPLLSSSGKKLLRPSSAIITSGGAEFKNDVVIQPQGAVVSRHASMPPIMSDNVASTPRQQSSNHYPRNSHGRGEQDHGENTNNRDGDLHHHPAINAFLYGIRPHELTGIQNPSPGPPPSHEAMMRRTEENDNKVKDQKNGTTNEGVRPLHPHQDQGKEEEKKKLFPKSDAAGNNNCNYFSKQGHHDDLDDIDFEVESKLVQVEAIFQRRREEELTRAQKAELAELRARKLVRDIGQEKRGENKRSESRPLPKPSYVPKLHRLHKLF